jgi:transcriptional regulator with XRE-family HTH domain
MPLSIEELGRLMVVRRGGQGIRAAAQDVGISPATLSRIENGNMPDLETFAKICRWLDRDPREFLGFEVDKQSAAGAVVHFRKKRSVSKETATALGELILAAQAAMRRRAQLIDQ